MNGSCEVCGNQYDKAFEVVASGAHHVFDSFDCGCHVIGHGVEAGGRFYCCAHCAHTAGVKEMRDRA